MEIRFKLDYQIDADLIQIITNRANGAPASRAVHRLLIEWMAILTASQLPQVMYTSNEVPKFPKADPPLGGYVYLIQSDLPDAPCKIGQSKNVPNRLKLFGVKLPFDFTLLHTIPCDDPLSAESSLHETFADKRANGEWYSLSSDEIANIQQIESYKNGVFILKDRDRDGDSLRIG